VNIVLIMSHHSKNKKRRKRMSTKVALECTCCKLKDSSTMPSDGLCNFCFSNCKGKGGCTWKGGEKPKNYSYSPGSYKTCHKGPVLVIDNGEGLKVYGSSRSEAQSHFYEFDLVIGLGEKVTPDLNVYASVRSILLDRLISKYYKRTEHIVLAWPDMGVPKLSRDFWLELVEVLKKKGRDRNRSKNGYKVLFHCMGGHGRTGTALAIMGHLVGKWEGDLTDKVREKHCEKAVETDGQIKYIEKVCKVKLKKGNGSKETLLITTTSTKGSSSEWPKGKDVDLKQFMVCRICKKEHTTIIGAIECAKGHEAIGANWRCTTCSKTYVSKDYANACFDSHTKKAESDKYKVCNVCKEEFDYAFDARACEKGHKDVTPKGQSPLDYFQERKKWRKEYSS